MSEYEALRNEILAVMDSVTEYAGAVARHGDALADQIEKLWTDNAALRDELHALANRVETLTRARLTERAEVAESMVGRVSGTASETAAAPMVGIVCTSPTCAFRADRHRHVSDGTVVFS